MKIAIKINGVSKTYGAFQALKNVSCDIYDNEFFMLLGPSGCGKTTLLRMIAGFETPTTGEIILHGENIQSQPAHKRRVNTVFQSYALFPHITVAENIAFGLENLKHAKADIEARVAEMLKLVHMEAFAKRKPGQLSGGQRQRVALARALAPGPEVLLLDEPLSALDLKLRQAMREELKSLQRQTGITFVFVTHDQEEALAMGDRICVLGDGQIQQLDTPAGIYEDPANSFVADFIGETNFLPVEVVGIEGDQARIRTPLGIDISVRQQHGVKNGTATMSLRPEKINFGTVAGQISLEGSVVSRTYMGGFTLYVVATSSGTNLRISKRNELSGSVLYQIGERVTISFAEASVRALAR